VVLWRPSRERGHWVRREGDGGEEERGVEVRGMLSAVTIEAMVEVRVTYWVDCIFHRRPIYDALL
jgi:hypothetical protein